MNEMTLPSRHMIQSASPGGLGRARYLSVTETPHNTDPLLMSVEETFL